MRRLGFAVLAAASVFVVTSSTQAWPILHHQTQPAHHHHLALASVASAQAAPLAPAAGITSDILTALINAAISQIRNSGNNNNNSNDNNAAGANNQAIIIDADVKERADKLVKNVNGAPRADLNAIIARIDARAKATDGREDATKLAKEAMKGLKKLKKANDKAPTADSSTDPATIDSKNLKTFGNPPPGLPPAAPVRKPK
jgi:hypothetical protein